MEKLRIGFVGVGGMGQSAHLVNYAAHPDCQVVAIAELRPQLGQKVAARWGIPKVYSGHQELLEKEDLDGIVAVQQFGEHAALVPQLLGKGVAVLTEKPLADSVESGQTILSAVKTSGTPLYLGYHKRSDPSSEQALRQITEWRASGEVGKFRYIRISMPPGDWVAEGFWQLQRTDETYQVDFGMSTPYGRFVNYYIHQVNLLRYFFGEDYRVIGADPTGVTMTVLSDRGVCGTLEMAAYQTTVDWQEELLIAFERGWIKVELPAPLAINRPGRITIFKDPGFKDAGGTTTPATTTELTLPWIHAMRNQANHFLQAIRGEVHPLCSASDGLKDLIVARDYIAMLDDSQRGLAAR